MNKKMVIGILTYNRKELLFNTVSDLIKENKNNIECFDIILVDNNSDLEYQKTNLECAQKYGIKYVFNKIEETENIDKNIELGHRRLISEMLKIDADVYCMLEDDWKNTSTIPVDDIVCFLSENKDVGQIRMRDFRYDDTFYGGSSVNFVTMKKIRFNECKKYGQSQFKTAELHWVDSCNAMRKEVLQKMDCSFDVEINRMEYFHKLYPINAQLVDGIFYHTGPQRVRNDLREKGLFSDENISQN